MRSKQRRPSGDTRSSHGVARDAAEEDAANHEGEEPREMGQLHDQDLLHY
jgi:hypothetical protein